MSERYYLAVYWGDRKESIDECLDRAARSEVALRELDPLFARWFKKGESREASIGYEVTNDRAKLKELFRERQQMSLDRRDKDLEEIGFFVDLWNGQDGPLNTCTLSLTAGAHMNAWNAPAPNSCLINLPREPSPDLLTPAKLAPILATLARVWEADWGTVTTDQHLMASMGGRAVGAPLVGWLTFISAARGRVAKKLPPGASVTAVDGLGAIYTASPDVFDWPQAAALDDALHAQNLVYPTGAPKPQAAAKTGASAAGAEETGAYAAALELAVLADAIAVAAPRARARRGDELADAATALLLAVAEGAADEQTRAATRVSALSDLAARLGFVTDEQRDEARALLAKLGGDAAP